MPSITQITVAISKTVALERYQPMRLECSLTASFDAATEDYETVRQTLQDRVMASLRKQYVAAKGGLEA